jgi:hypothetical protein
MPRIRFTEDFNWHPKPTVVIAYKAGREYPVTQRCADEAMAAGKVEKKTAVQSQFGDVTVMGVSDVGR